MQNQAKSCHAKIKQREKNVQNELFLRSVHTCTPAVIAVFSAKPCEKGYSPRPYVQVGESARPTKKNWTRKKRMASWARQRQQITEAADGGARARTGADGAVVLNLRRGPGAYALLSRADGQEKPWRPWGMRSERPRRRGAGWRGKLTTRPRKALRVVGQGPLGELVLRAVGLTSINTFVDPIGKHLLSAALIQRTFLQALAQRRAYSAHLPTLCCKEWPRRLSGGRGQGGESPADSL